ncbi:MAG TPA: hypothetical protein VFO35_19895, partial [Steroidobacteraceae bacterium]|nr:hypothetical protein [Steroidobacteraceae bacterium]
VVMPTFFKTNLLESSRGPAVGREAAEQEMEKSKYLVAEVARDVLLLAGAGRFYIVLPRSARMLWRLKRWAPLFFIKRVLTLREKMRAGQANPPPA